MPINPAFDDFPDEGFIVGKLVVSFGELELFCGLLAGDAIKNQDMALRAMYRSRSTSARIDLADVLMRGAFISVGLNDEYEEMLSAVPHSLSIRNQYAHCHWAPGQDGLFFADLEKAEKRAEEFIYDQRHVDLILLQKKECYFDYARSMLLFLQSELQIKSGNKKYHSGPCPAKQAPPSMYNPPDLHIPHWLSEDMKRQHLERAVGSRASPQERPPSILRLTEEEWAAKNARRDQ